MISLARVRGPLPRKVTAVAVMGWVFLVLPAFSHDDDHTAAGPKVKKSLVDHNSRRRGRASARWATAHLGSTRASRALALAIIWDTATAAMLWDLGPKAAIHSTAAPAIPTVIPASGGSGESIRFPTTAARVIPHRTTPITSECSAHWWLTNRSSRSPTIQVIVTMPPCLAPLPAGFPIPKPSSPNSRRGPRPVLLP